MCTLVQNELHDVKLILLVSFKGLVISTATRSIVQKLGSAVKEVARTKGSSWWHTPHMAAASLAIAERIPLVDFVLEVRDSRVRQGEKSGFWVLLIANKLFAEISE